MRGAGTRRGSPIVKPSARRPASCSATARSRSRWSVVAEVSREAAAVASRRRGSPRRSRGSARGARSRTASAPRRPPPRAWAAWVVSLLPALQPCRRRRSTSGRGPATWARRARCRRGRRRRRRNQDVSVLAPSMLLHSFQSFQRWRRARAIRSRRLQLCVGCTHADRQCVSAGLLKQAAAVSSDQTQLEPRAQADLASKDAAQLQRQQLV